MTDLRQGEALWPALEALPRGSGVVFRQYELPPGERRALGQRVRRIARRRGLVFVVAGSPRFARALNADGLHTPKPCATPRGMIRTAPAHDSAELIAAQRIGADLVFVSPAFPTQSHAKQLALHPVRFGALVRQAHAPVIALGGMNQARAKALGRFRIYGWAAIGALTPGMQG